MRYGSGYAFLSRCHCSVSAGDRGHRGPRPPQVSLVTPKASQSPRTVPASRMKFSPGVAMSHASSAAKPTPIPPSGHRHNFAPLRRKLPSDGRPFGGLGTGSLCPRGDGLRLGVAETDARLGTHACPRSALEGPRNIFITSGALPGHGGLLGVQEAWVQIPAARPNYSLIPNFISAAGEVVGTKGLRRFIDRRPTKRGRRWWR